MGRYADAIIFYRGALSLVIPERGHAFYVRADGTVGRRKGDTMFWVVVVEDEFETLATETVGDDVLALDAAAEELAVTVAALRSP